MPVKEDAGASPEWRASSHFGLNDDACHLHDTWLLSMTFSPTQIQPAPGSHTPTSRGRTRLSAGSLCVGTAPPCRLTQLPPLTRLLLPSEVFPIHTPPDPQQESSFLGYGSAVRAGQRGADLPEADPEHRPQAHVRRR